MPVQADIRSLSVIDSALNNGFLWQIPHNPTMNYKLPILSLAIAASVALWSVADRKQNVENRPKSAKTNDGEDPNTPSAPFSRPQQLVRQAVRSVEVSVNLNTKVRQRVQLFGRQIAGAGSYRQWHDGSTLRFRFDLKTQIGDKTAHLMEFCDGRFHWSRRQLPTGRDLQRVDLRQVQLRLDEARQAGEPIPPQVGLTLPSDGLAHLLGQIESSFSFTEMEEKRIGQERIPAWVVRGRWKPAAIRAAFPKLADQVLKGRWERLPEPVPHLVELVLGNDQDLPLFPYRISYLRTSSGGEVRIMDLEFFAVSMNTQIVPSDFQYDPGGQQVRDATEDAIARLMPVSK